MRHKILSYICAVCVIFGFYSCSDSWLQEDSLTESSSSTFWKTSDDAMMALVACYDGLQSEQLYNGGPWNFGPLNMDCMTDNGGHFNWSGWMEGYDIANGTHSPSSWAIGSYWSDCYEVIKRCNSLIANIDRVEIPENDRARFKAEALTLRALIYTNLTMTYNDVPYLTEPLTLENAECPATKRADIVAGEMANLKECANALPQNADLGRITKGACLAILGRMALYNEKWDEAISAYKTILGLGYSLAPDYATLFTQSGQNSPEIIFSVRFEGPGQSEGCSFNAHWNTPLEAMNGTLNLADEYYYLDGTKATTQDYADSLVKSGAGFAENRAIEIGSLEASQALTGYELIQKDVTSSKLGTSSTQKFGYCVPVTATEPEAAVRYVNFLMTSPELCNLLTWGVEGQNWVLNADGQATYPEGVTADTVGYHTSDFLYGNQILIAPWEGSALDIREQQQAEMDNAERSKYMGFSVDNTGLENTIAACHDVCNQFHPMLDSGSSGDYEKTLEEFNSRLEAAGMNELLAAYQEQLDAWLAENG